LTRASLASERDSGATGIRRLRLDDLECLVALLARNRAHLAPWEPVREERWWSTEGQRARLQQFEDDWDDDRLYAFAVLARGELIGQTTLSAVARGPFQNAALGYWIGQDAQGRGHASAAVRLTLAFAFEEAGLHRVQPAVLPHNLASQRVIAKVGFRFEGRAQRYLQRAGRWEDHDIYAMTAEEWVGSDGSGVAAG
jgi:ribosomal-protein-alanine N-acetyltransferase